jgi:uncharacterized protein (TIRG00374 family)
MWKRFLPVLLGLGLLALMFWKVVPGGWAQTWNYLKIVDPLLSLAALLCYLVMIYFKGIRWSYLIRMQGKHYSIWNCFLIYMSTLAIGNVTPGRAGDFAKVFYLKKDLNFSLGTSMANVLLDRVFDLYLLLILGCAGILIYPMPLDPNLIKAVWIFFFLLILVTVLAFNQKIGGVLLKAIFQRMMKREHKQKTDQLFKDFHRGMNFFYRPAIVYPIFLSVVAYAFFFIGCYLLAVALQIPISILYLSFCVSVVNIVSLITFLGLGTRDGALYIFFKLVGLQDQAEAYSMLIFFVGLILFSLVGLGCYYLKPIELGFLSNAPVSVEKRKLKAAKRKK